MKDNVSYIARHITVLGTGDMQTGFCRNGINFKASIDALIILRGFFIWACGGTGRHTRFKLLRQYAMQVRSLPRLPKISSFKRLFLDSLRVAKEIKPNLERVKEFSPFTDFFSSSTVMPQRDLTGQDHLLITLPMISKIFTSYMVSQERKR